MQLLLHGFVHDTIVLYMHTPNKGNKKPQWKTLRTKIAYKSLYVTLREDAVIKPNGEQGSYNYIDNKPVVFIVPLNDKNETFLIGQTRYPTQQFSWEFPGGGADASENLLVAAQRELKEETGLQATQWKKIGQFNSLNGVTNEVTHVFIARNLIQTTENKKAEEGIVEVKKLPLREVAELIKNETIADSQTIVAFTKVLLYLGYIFSENLQ